MRRCPSRRLAAVLALGTVFAPVYAATAKPSQDEAGAIAILLGRARTMEGRGRLDLARQDWAQVLVVDPNDAEALAGMVRAARADGKTGEAAQYLTRLKAAHPNDAQISRLEAGANAPGTQGELEQARRLAKAGDARAAMTLYRRVYGANPPSGGPALEYYAAEAGTDDGRPLAIAGLRAFADRFPADARYPVLLGKILLASSRTRAEGRTLLERFPGDAEARAALQAEAGTATARAVQPQIQPQIQSQVQPQSPPQPQGPTRAATGNGMAVSASPASTPGRPLPQIAARAVVRNASATSAPRSHESFATEEQAGFALLGAHHVAEAEQQFQQVLGKDPNSARALAGMGYVRSVQGDLKAAVRYFEQAQESGDRSLALTRALVNAQFGYALEGAAAATKRGDLPAAEAQYRAALRERPVDPEALEGLGRVLLEEKRPVEAGPVFRKLTEVRPLSPGAWQGLVLAEVESGHPAAALEADRRAPEDVRAPLSSDVAYQQALLGARAGEAPPATQLARNEAAPTIVGAGTLAVPLKKAQAPSASSSAAGATRVTPPSTQPAPPAPSGVANQPKASTPTQSASVTSGRAASAELPSPPVSAPVHPPATPGAATTAPIAPAPAAETQARTSALPMKPETPARPATRRRHGAHAPVLPAVPTTPPALAVTTTPSRAVTSPSPDQAIAAERTEQGNAALARGEAARAAELFRDATEHEPTRTEAWRGYLLALAQSGRPVEAAAAANTLPASVKPVLDRDASLQTALAAQYLASNRPNEAFLSYARAQEIFAGQRLTPPLEVVLRLAKLLAARGDDPNLYRELMYLGERKDLSDAQRREVQLIWTGWAVRRARGLASAGERRRAVVVLNAAVQAFPGNAPVVFAVADGYSGVGLPREALALYKAQDLSTAPVHDLEDAVQAATASRDFRTADGWIRLGRQRFPSDPEMLAVAAEFEQARKHEGKAEELARQARSLAPTVDAGQVLAAELREAPAGTAGPVTRGGQLAVLLAPEEATHAASAGSGARPFLPALPTDAVEPPVLADVPVLAIAQEPSR